ncbi:MULTISPECIES: hypothetical protein, partial [unclassified Sinorhizobium]|uniref:hypothetical protein n=1 Tax=unclassified Sinorhizobium TaxID=2613772 RepID=UPI0035259489
MVRRDEMADFADRYELSGDCPVLMGGIGLREGWYTGQFLLIHDINGGCLARTLPHFPSFLCLSQESSRRASAR